MEWFCFGKKLGKLSLTHGGEGLDCRDFLCVEGCMENEKEKVSCSFQFKTTRLWDGGISVKRDAKRLLGCCSALYRFCLLFFLFSPPHPKIISAEFSYVFFIHPTHHISLPVLCWKKTCFQIQEATTLFFTQALENHYRNVLLSWEHGLSCAPLWFTCRGGCGLRLGLEAKICKGMVSN